MVFIVNVWAFLKTAAHLIAVSLLLIYLALVIFSHKVLIVLPVWGLSNILCYEIDRVKVFVIDFISFKVFLFGNQHFDDDIVLSPEN